MTLKFQKIGLISATFIGISSIIGSGWLFAPYIAAKTTGGGALVSWVIGAFIIFLLGMIVSEIASLYPRRGLTAIIPTISHNKFYGFPFAISNWLGLVAVIALEASASVEYLVYIVPQYKDLFFADNELTLYGQLIAIAFIFFYALMNYWGATLLTKVNNIIIVFKLFVPLLTSVLVIYFAYDSANFVAHGGFFEDGFNAVLTAVLTAGIVVAFNGFQNIISFSSEIEKPHKIIPLSIGLSILFSLFIYLLLQTAFIGALSPQMLENGWSHLNFTAPMVQITSLAGLNFMILILYIDAIISPTGTAITMVGATTRMFTALAQHSQMPKYFDHIDPVVQISRRSLVLNILLAIVFLLVFRSWTQLAQILGLIHIFAYLSFPVALIVFRKAIKKSEYKFRLIFGGFISYALFMFFSYLVTLSTFQTALDLVIILTFIQTIFIISHSSTLKQYIENTLKSSTIFLYYITLVALTYISPNNENLLSEIQFISLVLVLSVIALFIISHVHLNKNIVTELNQAV